MLHIHYKQHHVHLHDAFKESEHPRASEGKSEGGQFVKKGTGGGGKSAIGGNPDKELKQLGLKTSGPVIPENEKYYPMQTYTSTNPFATVYHYTESWGIRIPGITVRKEERGITYEKAVSILKNYKQSFNSYKTIKKSFEKATRLEAKSIRVYKSSDGYKQINDCLRLGKECDNKIHSAIDGISSFLNKSVLPIDVITYRTIDFASKHYDLKNLEPGSIISDKGFVSTSMLNQGVPEKKEDVLLMVINIKKGTKGVGGIDQFGQNEGDTEYELLLQKGSRFKVTKYDESRSELHLEML